jgi:hypothetical protein
MVITDDEIKVIRALGLTKYGKVDGPKVAWTFDLDVPTDLVEDINWRVVLSMAEKGLLCSTTIEVSEVVEHVRESKFTMWLSEDGIKVFNDLMVE